MHFVMKMKCQLSRITSSDNDMATMNNNRVNLFAIMKICRAILHFRDANPITLIGFCSKFKAFKGNFSEKLTKQPKNAVYEFRHAWWTGKSMRKHPVSAVPRTSQGKTRENLIFRFGALRAHETWEKENFQFEIFAEIMHSRMGIVDRKCNETFQQNNKNWHRKKDVSYDAMLTATFLSVLCFLGSCA